MRCGMGRFATQNVPFWTAKRHVLKGKTARFGSQDGTCAPAYLMDVKSWVAAAPLRGGAGVSAVALMNVRI